MSAPVRAIDGYELRELGAYWYVMDPAKETIISGPWTGEQTGDALENAQPVQEREYDRRACPICEQLYEASVIRFENNCERASVLVHCGCSQGSYTTVDLESSDCEHDRYPNGCACRVCRHLGRFSDEVTA